MFVSQSAASPCGSGLEDRDVSLECRSNTFIGNSAIREGGAIATVNNQHNEVLLMGNVTAAKNSAVSGGVLFGTNDASIVIADGSSFDGNNASSNGGAVACVECAVLILLGVSMTSNQAASSGGALYAEASMAIQSQDAQYTGNWYVPLLLLDFVRACIATPCSSFVSAIVSCTIEIRGLQQQQQQQG